MAVCDLRSFHKGGPRHRTGVIQLRTISGLDRRTNHSRVAPARAIAAQTRSGSWINTAAQNPTARPDTASAPVCNDWLFPMTRPCSSSLTASEIMVAQLGMHTERPNAVTPRVTQSRLRIPGRGTTIMNRPVRAPEAMVMVVVEYRRDKAPTNQRFATTIGTATKATKADSLDTSKWKASTRYMGYARKNPKMARYNKKLTRYKERSRLSVNTPERLVNLFR